MILWALLCGSNWRVKVESVRGMSVGWRCTQPFLSHSFAVCREICYYIYFSSLIVIENARVDSKRTDLPLCVTQ